jgi:hypothetical protein
MLFTLRSTCNRCRGADWVLFQVAAGLARGIHVGAYSYVLKDCIFAVATGHMLERNRDA